MLPKQTNIPSKFYASKKYWLRSFLTLGLILFGLHFALAASHWRSIAPGIEYQDVLKNYLTPWSHIHAFRINLNHNQLSLLTAQEIHREFATADTFAEKSHASIAINAGFFDRSYHPIGLRIRNQQQLSAYKPISWWGIFYIQNNQPHIGSSKQFQHIDINKTSFAVQSGPRLLINGKPPSLKPGHAERSALGITRDGQVIILVTEHSPLSTTDLARIMKSAPLFCTQALNLDGGSSSQLYATLNHFRLNVHGFSNVSDAIIVKAR